MYALLVDRYKGPIFNLAYRMTGNREDADDLAQDVFIRAYEKLGSFQQDKKFFTWLYTIALNCIRSHMKNTKDARMKVDTVVRAALNRNTPEEVMEEEQKYRNLDFSMQRLPSEMREVLILRFYQSLTFNEIAEILDESLGAVKMRAYRGLQKLKSLMEHVTLNTYDDIFHDST